MQQQQEQQQEQLQQSLTPGARDPSSDDLSDLAYVEVFIEDHELFGNEDHLVSPSPCPPHMALQA